MNPSYTLRLKYCEVDVWPDKVLTTFDDDTSYGAYAHDTKHYRALAARCGYRADIHAYCREHEVAHSIVTEYLFNAPSRVLWALAHGTTAETVDILLEEELAISLQAFTRAKVLPGSSAPAFSWFDLRNRFIEALRSPK
jgi:hypothetical protein